MNFSCLLRAARGRHPLRRPAISLAFLFISSFILLISPSLRAQENLPPAEEVIRVETNLLTVPVAVTDERKHPVPGLTADEFELRDRGNTIPITYFAAGASRVALLYALDASGSTRDLITQQRETALALFTRFGRGSRLAVIQFRERPELVLPFSVHPAEVREAFRFAPQPNRRTAIFDAALAAVRAFAAAPPLDARQIERRIVVLLTDGLDNASQISSQRVIAEAQSFDVSIYVINLPLFVPNGDRLIPRPASRGVRELAERTGGRFFVVGDAASALNPRAEFNLRPVFEAIADDLQSQYILGFSAPHMRGANAPNSVAPEVRLISPRARRYRVRVLRR